MVWVRATRDFLSSDHGDWPMIAEGTIQQVKVDENGLFWAQTNGGDLYGTGRVGNGWEIISDEEAQRINREKRS